LTNFEWIISLLASCQWTGDDQLLKFITLLACYWRFIQIIISWRIEFVIFYNLHLPINTQSSYSSSISLNSCGDFNESYIFMSFINFLEEIFYSWKLSLLIIFWIIIKSWKLLKKKMKWIMNKMNVLGKWKCMYIPIIKQKSIIAWSKR
jgi:hypothetical protein